MGGSDRKFTPKRLINFTLQKLGTANLLPGRLEEAKNYLFICPECKKNQSAERLTKGVEEARK